MIAPSTVVVERAGRLRRGINLSHWYSQVYRAEGYTPAHFDAYIGVSDIALIQSLGFDHVRFPIAPEPIWDARCPQSLPAAYLARLDGVVEMLLAHDLAVIIDIHPESKFKRQLAADEDSIEAFALFWEAFAAHFSKFDSGRVFFEVLNEPEIGNPALWNNIQHRAVQAIRRSTAAHTIIISGDQWSQLPMLYLMELPADTNLICNFHLYDPSAFTHQGAKWAAPWLMSCKGLTYPSDPGFIRKFAKVVTDPEAARQLREYESIGWNASRYDALIAEAATWASERGYVLTCNEFGVYKSYTPRSSRLQWLRDVTRALEMHHVGWTMWDYAGDFQVVSEDNGKRIPDAEVTAALGLPPWSSGMSGK